MHSNNEVVRNNASLYNAIAQETGRDANVGIIRETFFLSMLHGANHSPLYATSGDYTCNDIRSFNVAAEAISGSFAPD